MVQLKKMRKCVRYDIFNILTFYIMINVTFWVGHIELSKF